MRIVLDLQALQAPANRSRGIGRAYRALVREIVLQGKDHDIHVVISGLLYDYAAEIWAQLSDILPVSNFHVWHGIAEVSWQQAKQHQDEAYRRQINTILYQAFLAGLNPDVVLLGNFCDGYNDPCLLPVPDGAYRFPVVMICYDLIPLVYPQLYDDRSGHGFIDFYRRRLAHLKNADHIFAISDSVKDDIVGFLDYPAERVTMTSLGFTSLSSATLTGGHVQDVCRKYDIRKPFILYVSAQDPRKNHVGVIEAFARLDPRVRDTHQIVFAGSNFINEGRGLYDAVRENDLPQSVLSIAVHPSDEDLQVLYKLAHLGIFASLYEGFGLGILESMAFGLPVIASNTSAMPEVMGRADALFDPTDVADVTAKIAKGLTDEAFRADLARYGLDHVATWDWARCGRRAVAAIELVHAKASPPARPANFSPRDWAIERIAALPVPDMPAADAEAALANAATAIELTYPTPPAVGQPRLFVDVSQFIHFDFNTGIQRVIKCIVIEMAAQLHDVELVLVYSRLDDIGYYHARNLQDHLLDGKSRLPLEQESTDRVDFAAGDVLFHSELTMPWVVRQHFHLQELRRRGVRMVYLVYDLIPINYEVYAGGGLAKTMMLAWLSCLLQGDKLISISAATEDEVRRCIVEYDLPHRPGVELDWFHLGGDFHKYIHPDTLKKHHRTSRVLERFREGEIAQLRGRINFLMVGTIEPRKNHVDMLKTIEMLWKRDIDVNLVVVGKIGWLDETQLRYLQQHEELGHRFFLFNDVSDDQLNELYALSSCLLYFSKVEGFGLPLIEAAQHGVPIIVRDLPIFREICGDHAFYFPDGLSPAEVAPYIEQWLALHARGAHPGSTGLPWLTWRDSIQSLIAKIFAPPDPAKRLADDQGGRRIGTSPALAEIAR